MDDKDARVVDDVASASRARARASIEGTARVITDRIVLRPRPLDDRAAAVVVVVVVVVGDDRSAIAVAPAIARAAAVWRRRDAGEAVST